MEESLQGFLAVFVQDHLADPVHSGSQTENLRSSLCFVTYLECLVVHLSVPAELVERMEHFASWIADFVISFRKYSDFLL